MSDVNYYKINEDAARRAKEMNSFSDYKAGSATAGYRQMVDKAAGIAAAQKRRVDPMYHEKIDRLLDSYARRLAENMNNGFVIDARVPSVLIAGPANFPARKKEKQNAARDRNMEEWKKIQGLLDRIKSTGTGGISADDPDAVGKLKEKLENLEESQEAMKLVNSYFREKGTLDGCPFLTTEQVQRLKSDMESRWHYGKSPYLPWQLSNNGAQILKGNMDPGFFIKHFIKDMKLALMEANRSGLCLEVLSQVLANYEILAAEGHGDLGTQALMKYYEETACGDEE